MQAKLRSFVERHLIDKLNYKKVHCPQDAEAICLLLDLIVCPYVSNQTKVAVAEIFNIDAAKLFLIGIENDHWFTAWGDKFNLGKELDAKRSREVY